MSFAFNLCRNHVQSTLACVEGKFRKAFQFDRFSEAFHCQLIRGAGYSMENRWLDSLKPEKYPTGAPVPLLPALEPRGPSQLSQSQSASQGAQLTPPQSPSSNPPHGGIYTPATPQSGQLYPKSATSSSAITDSSLASSSQSSRLTSVGETYLRVHWPSDSEVIREALLLSGSSTDFIVRLDNMRLVRNMGSLERILLWELANMTV